MSREWQQTKMKDFLMPDAVYYQSIWAVRDLDRMEKRVRELKGNFSYETAVVSDVKNAYNISKPTEKDAVELVVLEERVDAIRRALDIVPESYRKYIMSNIVLKNSGVTFPDRLWRIWETEIFISCSEEFITYVEKQEVHIIEQR